MTDHVPLTRIPRGYNTKAKIDKAPDAEIDALIERCSAKPVDFDGCLACYAYKVAQDRRVKQRRMEDAPLDPRPTSEDEARWAREGINGRGSGPGDVTPAALPAAQTTAAARDLCAQIAELKAERERCVQRLGEIDAVLASAREAVGVADSRCRGPTRNSIAMAVYTMLERSGPLSTAAIMASLRTTGVPSGAKVGYPGVSGALTRLVSSGRVVRSELDGIRVYKATPKAASTA